MSTILDIVRASGGSDVIIPTLELSCPVWAESVFICAGFDDQTCGTEDGRTVTFQAAGLDVSLPKKSNEGGQSLSIAIDNVRGDAQALIDQANDAGAKVSIVYRTYLDSDHSAPAEPPFRMTLLSAKMDGPTVNLSAGYFDLINNAWPRDRYTTDFAPGIKYL